MRRVVGYTGLQIGLHWLTAVLVLFNYLYSEGMADAFDAKIKATPPHIPLAINPQIHVWVGVSVLLIALFRIGVRFTTATPSPGGYGLMQAVASWGHRLLYTLIVLVPALGAITWFGAVEATADVHAVLANVLMLAALGHALIAIYHQFVLRDGLISRIVRPR